MNEDSRQRVLDLLARHGRDTTSFLSLEPHFRHWFHGDDACVAYVETGGAWVAAGGPITAAEREASVMQAFAEAARAEHRRVRFFGVEHELQDNPAFEALHLGEQPIWDPSRWPEVLEQKRSLREQLRRARAKGVVVRHVDPADLGAGMALRTEIEALVERWQAARPMAPMGFLVQIAPFDLPEERRFLIAELEGRLVGLLVAVPIYARGGWLLEDLLRDPEAPNGTVELLFDRAQRLLADEGCRLLSFGLAPLANTPHRGLRLIRNWSRPLYDFDGLARFKRKLEPQHWRPVYLAFPCGDRPRTAILDSLRAFAHGSLLRFAARTLRYQLNHLLERRSGRVDPAQS